MRFSKYLGAVTAIVLTAVCAVQAGSRHPTLNEAQVIDLATSIVLERPIQIADYNAPKVTYDAGSDTWKVFYSSGFSGHSFSVTVYDKTREARLHRINW
jgi:hypothetical protein